MLDDIIKKYQFTYDILESSPYPKVQLISIINFFRYCEEKNSSHLFENFIKDFLSYIVNIYKNSSVDFIDPYYLIASKFLLNKSLDYEKDDIVQYEIRQIIEMINIRLLVVYYYLGELDNGLLILKDILNSTSVKESGVSLEDFNSDIKKFNGKNNSLVDPNLFKVNKVFSVLRQINYEIQRGDSFFSNQVNILLVESDNSNIGLNNLGIVQSLGCTILPKINPGQKNPFVENIVDIQSDDINNVRSVLKICVNNILFYFRKKINYINTQINLRFGDLSGVYKGSSFGAGAATLIPAAFLNFTNSRTQYTISNIAAFTGSIDEKGNLLKLPASSVEAKVSAAFFSWVKFIVLPPDNLFIAKETVALLNKKYPCKKLDLIGIKNISEIFEYENIIKKKKESAFQYSKNTIKRHSVLAYTFLAVILVLLSIFAAKTFLPKNIKPLPQVTQQLNAVYTPDRDTVWKFLSSSPLGGDTIDFGEVGIGDVWCYKMDLWNNGNSKELFSTIIDGVDKDEFEIFWKAEPTQKESFPFLLPDGRQKMYLKFNPYKSEGNKNAKLLIFPKNDSTQQKFIYLKGYAGFYKNGYSLSIKGDDEFTISTKTNVLKDEFTISFWFKSVLNNTILASETPGWTQTKFVLRIQPDSTLMLDIIKSVMESGKPYIVKTKNKIKFDEWNFVAITHLKNKTSLILNEEVINLETKENHILQLEDFFYFGTNKHPVMRGSYNYSTDIRNLKISEIRMYSKSLSVNEIFSKKFIKENSYDNRLILYYDFEEANGKNVFDKTKNDVYGDFYGLTGRSFDYPPINIPGKNQPQKSKNNFVSVNKKGLMTLYKNLFKENSDWTIMFDAKAEDDPKKSVIPFMKIYNSELYRLDNNYYYGDSLVIDFSPTFEGTNNLFVLRKSLDNQWHKYIFDYSYEKNTGRLFIDGALIKEYNFGKYKYNIANPFFCIYFGNDAAYENPRYIRSHNSVDNIAIFEKTLSDEEIKLSDTPEIKKITGLLAFWDFSNIVGHNAFDEVNNIPLFLWEDFEILQR